MHREAATNASGGVGPGKSRTSALGEWVVKRGVLYFLTQTPMIALVIGYFMRWTTMPIATVFTVILAFAVLPVWILWRKSASDDPEEPVHHLHWYALYALIPYVVYNFARVPMHYLLGIVFWDHWYDFGYELTGQPVDQWSSLIPGTFLHSLQGYVLALGFFILYRRFTLANALIYVWLFLSVIYTFTFPTFVLVDFQPPPKWFFVVWWAHFWMAIAAWLVPGGVSRGLALWRRLRSGLARAVALLLVVVLYAFPFVFVFWRAGTWQFQLQHEIDAATFEQVELVVVDEPALASVNSEGAGLPEASYGFSLRFGPRPYLDYINATKAIDAGPVRVTARLVSDGGIVAWCAAYVEELETPNNILNPVEYFPALQRMEYTEIPVSCLGPADGSGGLQAGAELDLEWEALVTLIGDRETLERTYSGMQVVQVASAATE